MGEKRKTGVPVSYIGNRMADREELASRKYYLDTLIQIGISPLYLTSKSLNEATGLNENRFSTHYNTREDFEKDRNMILNHLIMEEMAPENILNKVVETVQELGLQFGD